MSNNQATISDDLELRSHKDIDEAPKLNVNTRPFKMQKRL